MNSLTVANTETIIGGTGDDTIILSTPPSAPASILRAGNDKLTFGNFANTATVANVETIIGGTANDTITLASALTTAMLVDLGAGSNKLTLAAGGNTGTVSNVDTLIGGSRCRRVTLATASTNGSIDLGAGIDTLPWRTAATPPPIANVETAHRRRGQRYDYPCNAAHRGDARRSRRRQQQLTLAATGNTATVRNVETRLLAALAHDAIIFATTLTDRQRRPRRRHDTLTLADGGNTLTAANVETLTGGTGADPHPGTAAVNASIDLGAGNDTLTFGNFANTANVANTETVMGGNAATRSHCDDAYAWNVGRPRRRQQQADARRWRKFWHNQERRHADRRDGR